MARSKKPAHSDGIDYPGRAQVGDGINVPEEHKTFDELARGGAAKGHDMAKKRAEGGKVDETGKADTTSGSDEGSGNPDFFAGKGSYVDKEAHKTSQAQSKKKGGRVKRNRGGHVGMGKMAIAGKSAAPRLDRKKRAAGGQVGADTRPLTSAAKLSPPKGDKREPEDD